MTGLTLFPESLRHLFSFGEPMLTPADVKGRTIRAISSLETHGDHRGPRRHGRRPGRRCATSRASTDGTIQGTDSGFTLASGEQPRSATSTATGNVALYAKVMTLVINSALWAGLDDAQRAIITTASDATRAWAIANQVTDAAAAARFCADGGTVVLADAASIAAFRAAEAPVYAALEADPATKRAIAAIRARARRATSTATVEACEPVIDATNLVPDGGDLPNGIYRIEATEGYLKDAYPDYVSTSVGIYTFTFRDGLWSFDYMAPDGGGDHQKGIYRVQGHDIDWLWDPCCSHPNPVLHLKWSVDGSWHIALHARLRPARLGSRPSVRAHRGRAVAARSLVTHRSSPLTSSAREVSGDPCSHPGRAFDRERPTEGSRPVEEPLQSRSTLAHGVSASIVDDLHQKSIPVLPHMHADRRRRRMLEGIRNSFGADEIGGGRQSVWEPAFLDIDADLDRSIADQL